MTLKWKHENKTKTTGNRAIWFVYRTDTKVHGFSLVKRTHKNLLETNRYFALMSYCNTISPSNNAFSILRFSLAGKRRVHVLIFSLHWLIKKIKEHLLKSFFKVIRKWLYRLPRVRESGFRNTRKFCWWNPESRKICLPCLESWALESRIQLKECKILLKIGMQNPSSTDKDCDPVLGIRNSWCGIKNPRLFTIYMGKPVSPRFKQIVPKIQDW